MFALWSGHTSQACAELQVSCCMVLGFWIPDLGAVEGFIAFIGFKGCIGFIGPYRVYRVHRIYRVHRVYRADSGLPEVSSSRSLVLGGSCYSGNQRSPRPKLIAPCPGLRRHRRSTPQTLESLALTLHNPNPFFPFALNRWP